jgi:NAD(P)-dependent dehydrogenase (short-subunit alcohol dehydrogenase family)
VNAVQPQLVVSEEDEGDTRSDDIAAYDDVLAAVRKRTPLRRLATPDEVASVCVSLLSSDFGYVTGQIIAVDGGYGLLS